MNFALWLEKKDIELYESILNEMERRQFLQAGLAGLAGLGLGTSGLAGEYDKKPVLKLSVSIKDNPAKKSLDIKVKIPIKSTATLESEEISIKNKINQQVLNFENDKRKEALENNNNSFYIGLRDPNVFIKYVINDESNGESFMNIKIPYVNFLRGNFVLNYLKNRIGSNSHSSKDKERGFHELSLTLYYTTEIQKNTPKGNPLQNPLRK